MPELSFLLIVFSHCTFGKYDCIHEVYRHETYAECQDARQGWTYAACTMISENDNQDPVIHSLGKQDD